MFLVVDCNNFFVSCERVFVPHLWGKPVIVLSNNDGCVVSRSNEAKKLGIPMAAPLFTVKDIVEKHNVAIFSGNFALYGDMSNRVMATVATMVGEIEQYSIDECFVELEHNDIVQLAKDIRAQVLKNTGIPVSIGIAPTKTLAKLANDYAKKHTTEGVYSISDEIPAEILALPIVDVWGIGRKSAEKCIQQNIGTVGAYKDTSAITIKNLFGVVGTRTQQELNGTSCVSIEDVDSDRKFIASTRSFGQMVTTYKAIAESVAMHASYAAQKLRRQQCHCASMVVYIRTNRHKLSSPQYSESFTITFAPTSDTLKLVGFAHTALKRIFKTGFAYKKAGVILCEITKNSAQQLHLFTQEKPQTNKLMQAMDSINKKHGPGSVRVLAEGFGKPWAALSSHKSKRYTTSWTELKTVE
jgi:DNA polymerase V